MNMPHCKLHVSFFSIINVDLIPDKRRTPYRTFLMLPKGKQNINYLQHSSGRDHSPACQVLALPPPTTHFCMSVTNTASANADVFDAVVVLPTNKKKRNKNKTISY